MKTLLFLILINCCVAATVFAQMGIPSAYAADLNRMMNNNMMNVNMTWMLNQNWYRGLGYQVNSKYDFKVTMKDNSVKIINSKIYADTTKHKSYLLYVNKDLKKSDPAREQKIYADQTLTISRIQNNFDNNIVIDGFATDSCWLFKVIKGKINVYSYLSEVQDLNETYLRAFQIDNSNVIKLDSTALDPIIKTDEKAYKPFLKGKFYRAIDKYNADHKTSQK